MKKVIMILAPGFEELEAIGTADILRRAGFQLVLAGLFDRMVTGAHGVPVSADLKFDEVLEENFDTVVLPGGMPGAANLYNTGTVIDFVKRIAAAGGVTAAICAAPIVLAKAGLLKDRRFTMYPGFDKYLDGAVYTDALAETDGNVVTGKGPGAVFAFSRAVAEALGADVTQLFQGMMVR